MSTLLLLLGPVLGHTPSALAQQPGLRAITEEVWPGKVTDVSGPNVLVVTYGGGSHPFRLEGIHVPENRPDLAKRVVEILRDRLVSKPVEIRVRGYVEDGAVPVGCILDRQKDVRIDLLKQGLVAYCPHHIVEPKLAQALHLAKIASRGLWAAPAPQDWDPCAGAA